MHSRRTQTLNRQAGARKVRFVIVRWHDSLICPTTHSDKTLPALCKYIHQELLPTLDEEDDTDIANVTTTALPFSAVEKAIEEVLTRNNYWYRRVICRENASSSLRLALGDTGRAH